MKLREIFRRKVKSNFPVLEVHGQECVYPSPHNAIVVVNFDKVPSFPDDDLADACGVVCVSDGLKGTLSHLTISQDARVFADSLFDYWNKPAPFVIYGGNDTISGNFLDRVKDALLKKGFELKDSDIGGENGYRHGWMSALQVEVTSINFFKKTKKKKVLEF